MAVEQTVNEMQLARSAAPRTDGEFIGEIRFSACSERGHLLVTHIEPLDLGLTTNGISEPGAGQ